MTAIILVGGKDDAPFMQTANEPFLFWLTQWLKKHQFNQIVYSAAHNSEKIQTCVNDIANREPKLCLDVVTENTPLGTGGAAALSAQRHPANTVLITNGDSLLLEDLQQGIAILKSDPQIDGILFATTLPNAGRFGRLALENNQLVEFKEKEAGSGPINAGIYLLRSKLLREIASEKNVSLERDCFPAWLKQGKHFHVIVSKAPFLDLGSQDGLKQAEQFFDEHHDIIMGPL